MYRLRLAGDARDQINIDATAGIGVRRQTQLAGAATVDRHVLPLRRRLDFEFSQILCIAARLKCSIGYARQISREIEGGRQLIQIDVVGAALQLEVVALQIIFAAGGQLSLREI